MAEKTVLHVITRADLLAGRTPIAWEDPHGVAAMSELTRRALLDNPLGRRDDQPVQIIGTLGNCVTGRIDAYAGQIDVDGSAIDCLWTSAYQVPEEYRKTLVGVSLALKFQQLYHTSGACGISHAALPVFEKLRWWDFPMPRYLAMRRSRSIVERYFGRGIKGTAARIIADVGLLAHRAMLSAWRGLRARSFRVEEVQQMSAEMNPVLDRSGTFPAKTHRSAAWVNWILTHSFTAKPRDRRGLFYVYGNGDTPVAYFFLKSRFYETATHRNFRDLLLGSLQDWIIFDESQIGFHHLVLLALKVCDNWDVDAAEICLPPDVRNVNLRRWGFIPAGQLHLMIKARTGSALADEKFSNPSLWRIRPADGDNAFV